MKDENGQIKDVETPLGKIIEGGANVVAIGIYVLIAGYVVAILAVIMHAMDMV